MKRTLKLFGMIAVSALFTITSCQKEDQLSNSPQSTTEGPDMSEKGMNPDETALKDESARRLGGFLYIEGNELGTNNIHIFRQHPNGSLTLEGTVASGGSGSGAALGSQGALALSNHHRMLFAVNAGDNSVSAFRVRNNGSLTITDTKSTSGTLPVSVCVHRNIVYVVNSGSDNISGFMMDAVGDLNPIPGSILPLSGNGVAPAQISFSPNGHYLYVTEKMTNTISVYEVDANGLATPGNSISSTGTTPFGFDFSRNSFMIVTNASGGIPNASSVTSYSGINTGNLNAINNEAPNNQSASCWVTMTAFERFAFVTNTGSDNISTYYVSPWGGLYLVDGTTVATGDAPSDIVVAANNYYVYNINASSNTITRFHRTFLGGLVSDGITPGLPDFAAGLVAI